MKIGRMSVGPLRLPDGQLVNEYRNVVDVLADTFAAVFVEEYLIKPAPCQIYDGEMYDVEISIDKVYAALQSLNASSAVGSDKVHPQVLKACASELAAPLCIILNYL